MPRQMAGMRDRVIVRAKGGKPKSGGGKRLHKPRRAIAFDIHADEQNIHDFTDLLTLAGSETGLSRSAAPDAFLDICTVMADTLPSG